MVRDNEKTEQDYYIIGLNKHVIEHYQMFHTNSFWDLFRIIMEGVMTHNGWL